MTRRAAPRLVARVILLQQEFLKMGRGILPVGAPRPMREGDDAKV